MTVTVTLHTGPEERSPPSTSAPTDAAAAPDARHHLEQLALPAPVAGMVTAHSTPIGSAPSAARSDSAAAVARQPTSSGPIHSEPEVHPLDAHIGAERKESVTFVDQAAIVTEPGPWAPNTCTIFRMRSNSGPVPSARLCPARRAGSRADRAQPEADQTARRWPPRDTRRPRRDR